jgi:2,4-dienoyl-CoA reductase-like NADH-dependent reductase (Old Yellow Enzyme family)
VTTKPLLFTPITIRDATLKNRVVIAPMATYSAVDGIARTSTSRTWAGWRWAARLGRTAIDAMDDWQYGWWLKLRERSIAQIRADEAAAGRG